MSQRIRQRRANLLLASRALPLVGICTLAFFTQRDAQAQSTIVNSQSMDLSARAEDWMAQSRVSVSYAAGNVEKLSIGFNLKVQHQNLWTPTRSDQSPWLKERWMVIGSLASTQAGEKTVENQGLVHLRWTRMWLRRWGHELFLQSRYNEFLRLKQRALAGAGIRFDFLNRDGWLGWLGSAYMFEYNHLKQPEPALEPRRSYEHRWSSYVALRKSAMEDRLLSQLSAFVQPRFDRFSDLRAFVTMDLVAKIGEHLGLGFNGAFAFDARPPLGVKKRDIRISSTLTFKL